MTAREGRDTVVGFVKDSSAQLDITGWWSRGTAYAAPCSSDPDNSSQYAYDHWAPRGQDPLGDAKRIADYWESLGMSVTLTGDTTDSPSVFAKGGPVLRASFDTGATDESYLIDAIAPCSPGDYSVLNEEDDDARNGGEVLPGDDVMVPESKVGEKFDEHLRLAKKKTTTAP